MSSPFSSSRAYVIGISNYQHTPWRLQTPLRDAEALADQLRTDHGFETVLRTDVAGAGMHELFEQIKRENTAEDSRVLIYYAGHGVQLDSAMGLKGFFLPADAQPGDESTMIPMESLSETLRQLPSRHILLVLDCCFAGAFRMPERRSVGFDTSKTPLRQQHYEIFCNFPSRLLLSSTSQRQKAFDRLEDGDVHSPFNRFLRKALAGEADYSRDKLVTAGEIRNYLVDSVSRITQVAGNLQSVGLDALDGDGDGEFLFPLGGGFEAVQLPPLEYINPYKGLQSYDQKDAALFFGRQDATKKLLELARNRDFVIVTGASGTGKSSLVKAGLLPRLSPARIMVVRPGKHPMAVIPSPADWDLLVVDQWEELITQAVDEKEVEAFYKEIRRLLDTGKRIIGTVRSDFEAQTRHETLDNWWNKGRFVVPPFSSEEYREIIVQPAKRVACLFESPELVKQIEQEVAQQPGPLPLLSFMLSELFKTATQRPARYWEIKEEHYQAVGGVSGALRQKAEEVYNTLPTDAHRDTMRRVMLRMVSQSAGEIAGRRVYLDELDYQNDAEDGRIATVIKYLDEAKLIRRDADDAQRRFIEPAHDALVRAWKQLWDWVKALGVDNLLLIAKLSGDVAEYRAQQSLKKFLWHENPRLDQVVALRKTEPMLLNQAEQSFVEASIKEKKRLRRRLNIIATIVGVIILISAGIAWIQRSNALKNELDAKDKLDKFLKAEAARLAEARKKERFNFDKYLLDGNTFTKSGDYDMALIKYYNADSIYQLYLWEESGAEVLMDSFCRQIERCR